MSNPLMPAAFLGHGSPTTHWNATATALRGARSGPRCRVIDGYAYGSLSMTCSTVDAPCPEADDGDIGAAPLATELAPEDANV